MPLHDFVDGSGSVAPKKSRTRFSWTPIKLHGAQWNLIRVQLNRTLKFIGATGPWCCCLLPRSLSIGKSRVRRPQCDIGCQHDVIFWIRHSEQPTIIKHETMDCFCYRVSARVWTEESNNLWWLYCIFIYFLFFIILTFTANKIM